MSEFVLRASYAVAAKVYSQGMTLLLLAITSRLLGAEGYGLIAAATTWVMLFVTIGHFSLGQVAQHYAATEGDEKWLDKAFGSLLFITLILSVTIWVIALLMYALSIGKIFGNIPPTTFLIALLLVPFLIWEVYGSGLLLALDKIEIYNRAQVIGRTLAIPLIFIFVQVFDFGMNGALLSMVFAQVFISGFGIKFLLSRTTNKVWFHTKTIRILFNGGVRLHLNAIGAFLFSSANILIIQYYRGPADAGYYQIATQLVMGLFLIPQTISQLLYGKLTLIGANGIWKYQKKILIITLMVMILLACGMGYAAESIISLVASDSFMPAAEILRIYLLVIIAGTINSIMGVQWIGRGLFWQASLLTIVTGLINFSLNMVLIPKYGATGAAWATVAGVYLIPFATNMVFAYKIEKEQAKGFTNGSQ